MTSTLTVRVRGHASKPWMNLPTRVKVQSPNSHLSLNSAYNSSLQR